MRACPLADPRLQRRLHVGEGGQGAGAEPHPRAGGAGGLAAAPGVLETGTAGVSSGPGRGSSSFLFQAFRALLRLPRPRFRSRQGRHAQCPETSWWHVCARGGWHPPACPELVARLGAPARGPSVLRGGVAPSWAQAGGPDPSVVPGTSLFGPRHQAEQRCGSCTATDVAADAGAETSFGSGRLPFPRILVSQSPAGFTRGADLPGI